MSISHAQARQILVNRFPRRSPAWYQGTQAVAYGEGGYGNGWTNAVVDGKGKPWVDASQGPQFQNACAGSNNWGADQTKASDPNSCPNLDHHSNGAPYQGHFKTYPTPEDGAADFIFVLTDNGPGAHNRAAVAAVLDAPDSNGNLSADAIAEAMHTTGYFELRTDLYAQGIAKRAATIAKALGEPQRVFRAADMPPAAPGIASIAGGRSWAVDLFAAAAMAAAAVVAIKFGGAA